jgi:hypothetical protein
LVDFVSTKNLSYESFGPIPLDGAAQLLRRRDAEPPEAAVAAQDEQRAVAAVNPDTLIVDPLKLAVTPDSFGWPKLLGWLGVHASADVSARYSLLTVRRFRPLARRRFSTRRPFLVLMRTRNPWVRFRCRVFG